MKKSFLLAFIFFLAVTSLVAQAIPNEITFHYTQTKATVGTQHTDYPPNKGCITFKKNGNDIKGVVCSDGESVITYSISGVQSEKHDRDVYAVTYFGYQYFASTPVYSFLTYGYNYHTSRWNVMIEWVTDNPTDGIARTLINYFNMD